MELEMLCTLFALSFFVRRGENNRFAYRLKEFEEIEKEKEKLNQQMMYLAVILADKNALSDTMITNMMRMEGEYNE